MLLHAHTQTPFLQRGALSTMVGFLLCTSELGCSKRTTLSRPLLQQVRSVEGGQKRIRVLLNHRIELEHGVPFGDEIKVDHRLHPRKVRASTRTVVGRQTQGKILATKIIDGSRKLWVSFDHRCRLLVCAFQFIESGTRDRFMLQNFPETLPPGAHGHLLRGLRRRPLEFGSLQASELRHLIWYATDSNQEILTVHLEIRVARKLGRHRRKHARGWGPHK